MHLRLWLAVAWFLFSESLFLSVVWAVLQESSYSPITQDQCPGGGGHDSTHRQGGE